MFKLKKEYIFDDKEAFFSNYNIRELIFFDIETTGFSIEYSIVYLIGVIYYKNNQWILEQFFADNPSEEKEIIEEFFLLASNYSYIIHFNGDNFDIPYLEKKASLYDIETPFSKMSSIDILKHIRPYQKILGLENCKLKTIEMFLGINRKDIYSGKDLIEQYNNYCENKKQKLKENILLHNEEDLYGLIKTVKIYGIINYINNLKDINFIKALKSLDFTKANTLIFSIELLNPSPISLVLEDENWSCVIKKDSSLITFNVTIINDIMYHFFPNYKDYFYLIEEDEAIHKSLGIFLPKDKRKAAKVSNCYTKKKGAFLQIFDTSMDLPIFKKSYNSKDAYILFDYNEIKNHKLKLINLSIDFIKSKLI